MSGNERWEGLAPQALQYYGVVNRVRQGGATTATLCGEKRPSSTKVLYGLNRVGTKSCTEYWALTGWAPKVAMSVGGRGEG